jgi:hypothetical protein
MKPAANSQKKPLPKGFTIKPGLDEKYANQPFFLDKAEKAKKIIEKYGLPDFDKK